MRAALIRFILLLPLAGGIGGCCAPSELLSCIDRHCFAADWTNHHSCVSCCCKNGSCQQAAPAVYPMLELGKSSTNATAVK